MRAEVRCWCCRPASQAYLLFEFSELKVLPLLLVTLHNYALFGPSLCCPGVVAEYAGSNLHQAMRWCLTTLGLMGWMAWETGRPRRSVVLLPDIEELCKAAPRAFSRAAS